MDASTAAPPIIMRGISATSNKATPAAITPMVATVVTKSCVGIASLPARVGAVSASSDPRLTSICTSTQRFPASIVAATKIGKNAAECAQNAKIIASSALRLRANLQVFDPSL
ncbi:MAG: hypothetical protein WA624_05195 [Methylocella sp.]